MKHVVVYGPAACGKTRNKGALAKAYGCSNIMDEVAARDLNSQVMRSNKTLFLFTSSSTPRIGAAVDDRYFDVVPFAEAMRVAGLQP
jgi:hypothetical protein